jgi:hypothetical protein
MGIRIGESHVLWIIARHMQVVQKFVTVIHLSVSTECAGTLPPQGVLSMGSMSVNESNRSFRLNGREIILRLMRTSIIADRQSTSLRWLTQ